MQLEAGPGSGALPTFYKHTARAINHTAYIPCPLVPPDSELRLMSPGKMFILGPGDPWEGVKRPGMGTKWHFLKNLLSVIIEGFMMCEENMKE